MKRVKLDNGFVFEIPFEDIMIRAFIDDNGIMFWKRGQGNLDFPRPLDKTIELSWENAGNSGTCYLGSRSGRHERGPAKSRQGLHWLTHKKK